MHEGVADDDGTDGGGGAFELVIEDAGLVEGRGDVREIGDVDEVIEAGKTGACRDIDATLAGAREIRAGGVDEPLDLIADVDEKGIWLQDFFAFTFVVEARDFDERLGVSLLRGESGAEERADYCQEEE